VSTNRLEKKIVSLDQVTELAEKADLRLTESLRRIALEICERIFQEKEYIESRAELIPLTCELVSSFFESQNDLARRLTISLRKIRMKNKLKLENLKGETEKAILNMKPAELYAFFKNPRKFLIT